MIPDNEFSEQFTGDFTTIGQEIMEGIKIEYVLSQRSEVPQSQGDSEHLHARQTQRDRQDERRESDNVL
jgi:hypothetical protein